MNIENYQDLKELLNSLTEDQLKQPVKGWGDEFAFRINSVNILEEDYINPSGDGCEPRSVYEDEPDYEDEPASYEKGTVLLEGEKF